MPRGHAGVVDAAARFTHGRRRRWRRSVFGAAALVTVGAAGWATIYSPLLEVRHVVIHITLEPRSRLSVATVRQSISIPAHEAMVDVDPAQVAAAVRSLPAVAAVAVRRNWPQTLEVDVVPRHAVAVIEHSGVDELIDPHGVAFARIQAASATPAIAALPLIHDPESLPSIRSAPVPAAVAAVGIMAALPRKVRREVSDVELAGSAAKLHIGTMTVIWGSADGTQVKGREVAALVDRPKSQRPHWVDVSTPGVVITKHT